jgi:hypothetical protein
MVDRSYLSWPFFEAAHRDRGRVARPGARAGALARGLAPDCGDAGAACRPQQASVFKGDRGAMSICGKMKGGAWSIAVI